MEILRPLLKVFGMLLSIAGLLYVSSNGSVSAVEDVSLADMIRLANFSTPSAFDPQRHKILHLIDMGVRQELSDITIDLIKAFGGDADGSVYRTLKSQKVVSDVLLSKVGHMRFSDGDADVIALTFDSAGTTFSMKFLAADKSFLRPLSAKVFRLHEVVATSGPNRKVVRNTEAVGFLMEIFAGKNPRVAFASNGG